jgi:hypothetical protein
MLRASGAPAERAATNTDSAAKNGQIALQVRASGRPDVTGTSTACVMLNIISCTSIGSFFQQQQ